MAEDTGIELPITALRLASGDGVPVRCGTMLLFATSVKKPWSLSPRDGLQASSTSISRLAASRRFWNREKYQNWISRMDLDGARRRLTT